MHLLIISMLTQFLHADLAGFAKPFPTLDRCALAAGPIEDFSLELFAEERAELAHMVDQRAHAFSSGRHCAHLAQQLLGQPVRAVLREDRAPLWPAPSVGSISHSRSIAVAVAALDYRSVGVDLESAGRLKPALYERVFTAHEVIRINRLEPLAASIMFSAKEAGYKAIYPLARTYIGFKEAEINLVIDGEFSGGRFSIDYVGDHAPNRTLNSGYGYWSVHQQHVMTLFVIP